MKRLKNYSEIAKRRGQTVSQLALSWILRNKVVASVIVGASKVSQIEDNVGCINNLEFSEEELKEIEEILK